MCGRCQLYRCNQAGRRGDLTRVRLERRPIRAARFGRSARLCIGFWRVGFGAQVLDFEQAQCLGVATGSEAGAVVGHDALNLNAMDPEEAQRVEEKAQAGATFSSGKISENGRRSPNADIPNQPRGCCFDLCDRR